MARRLAFWGAALLLALPQFAWALGLGSIELRSALNQPLAAEIPLTSASDEDLASLRVELASLEAFQRQGLERPPFLDSLRFAVIRRADGTPALRVTSTQAAREPFLTFLVEARWARGRVLREYTVLLDPPTFMETPAREAPVTAPRTPAVAPDERTGRVARPAATPQPQAPAARLPAPTLADDGTYLVQRNDTLSGLARQLRPTGDISLNQMMMGLFEANPEAFDGNINRLRAGARLAIPSSEALRRMTATEATARVASQNRAWRDAPAASEPAPRLRLVAPGEAPAGGTGQAAEEARAEAAGLRDEAVRLRDEAAGLRDELAETRRLLEVRDAELATLQQQLAEQRTVDGTPAVAPVPGVPGADDRIFVDDAPAPDAEPAPSVAESPPPAAQPAPPAPAPAPAAAPGLVQQIMGWLATPLLWIGLGAAALVGALAVFMRRRRERAAEADPWEAATAEDLAEDQSLPAESFEPLPETLEGERTQRMAAAGGGAAAALATGASAQGAGTAAETGVHAQEVSDGDPLAEADFHMAYGLYDQAADLVQQALADAPARSDLHLKLVEIYFVWGNQAGFIEAARALKEQVGDGAEWDKTLIMARQICPDEPLFAGETASGDLELDFEGGEDTGIYSLDFEVEEDPEDALSSATSAGLDMQFEDDPEAAEAAAEEAFMLDIGSRTATNIERGLLDDDEAAADSPTMETPTIESPELSETAESPAPELWAGDETVESPRPDSAATVEAPTLEQPRPGGFDARLQGLDAGSTAEIDLDDLGLDLEGLDVELSDEDIELTGLGDAVIDLGDADQAEEPLVDAEGTDAREALFDIGEPEITGTQAAQAPGEASPEEDEDLLSATGITQVLDERELAASRDEMLLDDNDATRLAPSLPGEDDPTRRIGSLSDDDVTRFAGSLSEDDETRLAESLWDDDATRLAGTLSDEEGVDRGAATARIDVGDLPAAGVRGAPESVDEGADTAFFQSLSEEAAGDNTVEQPRPRLSEDEDERFAADVFGAGAGGTAPDADDFDLEIGELLDGGGADEPTGEIDPSAEPETLTELGTKLDLARAYIDMGDPEGARSILEEVIEEGDGAHRQEARQLLETLGD